MKKTIFSVIALFAISCSADKKSANLAAMKAFLVNRVADFGFLIGIASLYIFLDTLSINEIINRGSKYKILKSNYN